MRIALAQIASSTDPAENLEQIADNVARAAGRAELVVFPEEAMCSSSRKLAEIAEPLTGPWATAVRKIAADAGVTVVVGMFTPATSGRVRNTLLVTGAVETHYDKIHLFDALGYAESDDVERGTSLASFTLSGHRIGLATCYDVRFPAQFVRLANAGADAILLPASWAPGETKLHHWRTLTTARALDATSFLVAVDQAQRGRDTEGRRQTGIGHSRVVGPTGEVITEVGEAPELAIVELDLPSVAAARATLPVLRNEVAFD